MAESRTYGDLLTYVFPTAPTDSTDGTSTAGYNARERPPSNTYLMRSDPHKTGAPFPDRAIAALRRFFHAHSLLDKPLPPHITSLIDIKEACSIPWAQITSERDAGRVLDIVFEVVRWLVADLALRTGQCLRVQLVESSTAWSQDGDLDFLTLLKGTETVLRTVAIKEMKPSFLKAQRKALCAERHTLRIQEYPGDAKSVLFKLFLHMYSLKDEHGHPSRIGILFDGFRVIFAERYLHNMVHGFVTSSYDVFEDQAVTPSTTLPLLGVLLALAIPDVTIEAACLPAMVPVADTDDSSATPPLPATLVPFAMPSNGLTSLSTTDNGAVDIPKSLHLVVDPAPEQLSTSPVSSSLPSSTTAPSPSSDLSASGDVLVATRLLHRGPDAKTWLVRRAEGGPPYVAKVFCDRDGMWDQALREASAVRAVRALCGDITPSVLGLYRWKEDEGGLMLQEYGGMKLTGKFGELPQADRDAIWAIANQLHSHGVCHGDIEPRNFVRQSNGIIHILDFGRSDLRHECLGPQACDELRRLANELNYT